ncbi:hypothetical protein CQA49_09565 [Helicobacter sp. MIT 00-7814]|uniref:hypothetical protein n=1 Tax=unclassified Helicobacter TaxID=2593540 RepID=UPI000E1EE2C8|nr:MULTISPECIES: hypothetical protein [unclassified Helicobacter]RDU51465.1 hypothetical protein CQA49_09565 [Helicobacter sp. MIT 00-7814]RDU51999.1 hypothetical protein CQA37_09060 [Helicobacter sp. MIT 99-10781]
MTEKCKMLKLPKSLRLFVAITPLVFLFGGCIGWGWFVPYSLQPSYWEFKKIARLEPKTYEALGGKLDDEYFAKLLALVDMDWDTMIKTKKPLWVVDEYMNIIPNRFAYKFNNLCKYNCRLKYDFTIYITMKGDEVAERTANFSVTWWNNRNSLSGNEGSMEILRDAGVEICSTLFRSPCLKYFGGKKDGK